MVHRWLTLYHMVVWMMQIIQGFQVNVSQSHKYNICRLYTISRWTTRNHKLDCQFLFSWVFASSWFCYTSPFLSLFGIYYNLNLSLYRLRIEITIVFDIIRFWCTWYLFLRTNNCTTCIMHYADKCQNGSQIAKHICNLIQPCIFIEWVTFYKKKK